MASDLDLLLIATLEDRAGGDVDPMALTRAAVSRGRRIRCRRAVAGGAALVTVAVLGTGLLALPALRRSAEPAPTQTGVALTGRAPILPPATGQAGAATRPDLVGVDPRVLHFSVDAFTGTAAQVTWTVRQHYERAEISGAGFEATVEVSPFEKAFAGAGGSVAREAPVTARVAGLVATLSYSSTGHAGGPPLWSIRWQPTAGLWARVDVRTQVRRDAERLAAMVRFDVAQRCVLPFVLATLPGGMVEEACSVTVSLDGGTKFVQGTLTCGTTGESIAVRATATAGTEAFVDGLRAGPHLVHVDGGAYFTAAPPYWVDTVNDQSSIGRAKILQVLSGLRTHGEVTDPKSW